eukprot:1569260-Prymnesium_polylepis.1
MESRSGRSGRLRGPEPVFGAQVALLWLSRPAEQYQPSSEHSPLVGSATCHGCSSPTAPCASEVQTHGMCVRWSGKEATRAPR